MDWFGSSYKEFDFQMYSTSHIIVLLCMLLLVGSIYKFRQQLRAPRFRIMEIALAVFLLVLEAVYQLWMIVSSSWDASHALPLELCSIGLFLTAALLITRKKIIYEVSLFTGLLGASQALFTPFLNYDFPHFRFFHFFITHLLIFSVPFYFTWVKGFRPTIYSVVKTMAFLNILLPVIFIVNLLVDGNYLYIARKPENASLLDVLGPYPWYILTLEFVALSLSLLIWLLFRQKETNIQSNRPFQRETYE
ncbi:YwaF family protein [Bacillus xiapuensis]|uniref:YwaF family protein n=1 Tax=Bacillus xiapuensis TaxID=2014075 RepID=UPI000C24A2AC|nr:TIGR02206 family membrane protein [Bacillus xiapuensis]